MIHDERLGGKHISNVSTLFLWIQPLLTTILNLNKKFQALSIFFLHINLRIQQQYFYAYQRSSQIHKMHNVIVHALGDIQPRTKTISPHISYAPPVRVAEGICDACLLATNALEHIMSLCMDYLKMSSQKTSVLPFTGLLTIFHGFIKFLETNKACLALFSNVCEVLDDIGCPNGSMIHVKVRSLNAQTYI